MSKEPATFAEKSMDSPAPLCVETPLLHACSPVPLALQKLEESRARLLHPIKPSASWLASLKPLDTQSRVVPGHLTTRYILSALDCKCYSLAPDQAQPPATKAKKPLPCSAFSEPIPLGLENSFLKQPAHFGLKGLKESRARLLRPVATSSPWLASLKPLAVQFSSRLDPQEKICGQMYLGLPPSFGAQDEAVGTRTKLEQPQEDGDEVDLADEMPEYVLSVPEDQLKVQTEEKDPSGEAMPLESEEQHLKEQKLMLVSLACCSLVEGPKFGNPPSELQEALMHVCKSLAELEPEFILKVALYTRQELNIRSTANFLLALSSRLLPCRPYLRRYFCHTVQLPSDWKEVARLYQILAGEGEALAPMPSCLRAAMADKFRQFDVYQLAKYNTRKSQGKKSRRPKIKKPGPGVSNSEKHSLAWNRPLVAKLKTLQNKFRRERPKASKDLFSLKALVQRLHIGEPSQHVMSLLGCRYPSDLHAFSRSRLPGPWDSSLAGTRMKLPKPQTWDRELSQHGNNAAVWEELIDAGKLPFMAMLRNLRSILRTGVSERHHKRLLKRLEDKESVIHSRQLPFRFLAAYKIIQELEKDLEDKEKPCPSNTAIVLKIVKEFGLPISKPWHIRKPKQSFTRRRLRYCMDIPVIFQMVKQEKKKLSKARDVHCSRAILQRYREALETAIHVAVRYNVPPIPGRTLILISCQSEMCEPYVQARDLCCPSTDQKDHNEQSSKPLTKLDMAMLLGSMVYSVSEQAQLNLCSYGTVLVPVAMTGSVLKDVQLLQSKDIGLFRDRNFAVSDVIMDLIARRQHVDTILLLSDSPEHTLRGSCLWLYRHHVAPECLFVNVCARAASSRTFSSTNEVVMSGFSEQVLRFMAECGGSRFLEHVEKADEVHGLPKQRRAASAKEEMKVAPLIPAPKSRWRSVRVFVSSTFRDMHGERDLLIRCVFPELRARAAQFCLTIEDIDLRWGITEHESQQNKQLELCLSEVSQSQLFIGILGERYGHVPEEYSLPDEPQFEWMKSYPTGRSITELESVQFLNGCNNPASASRAFFYLREPDFLGSVPDAWKADFVTESEEAKSRLADFKECLEKYEGVASIARYVCQWGGVAQGRPYVKSLEDFGVKVLQDVWECLRHQFIEREGSTLDNDSDKQEENVLQDSFQELQQRRFCARAKLLHATVAQLRGGKLYVVSGEPGQGKTVFLAALSQVLRMKAPPQKEDPAPSYHVVAHFTRARPDQAEAQVVLSHLCAQLRKLLEQPPTPPRSYRGLVGQFESLLHSVAQSLKRRQSLVVLVDGADLIHVAGGQLVSDWLPEELPPRVSLVLSVSEESALLGSLKRWKDAVSISLGALDPPDRVAVVRQDLALYGKKLEESAFNNQMRLVLLKRGSRQPLYLTLLTQDLRLFALYEKLSERIQKLPVSLPLLLQHLLGCLEQDHGVELVAVALVALWASRDGLTEQDLYAILADWKELNGTDFTLEEVVGVEREAGSYPMAPFFDFLRSLRGLLGACGSPTEPPGSRLHLYNTPLRMAVERRYQKKPGLERRAHVLLAAHWLKRSDPVDSGTFQKCEAEPLLALPYHLVQSGCFDMLADLLIDLEFLSAHVRLGLLHCLSAAYALWETGPPLPIKVIVRAFRAFLQRNIGLFSQNPLMVLQQAANEPHGTSLCVQALDALRENGRLILRWINKPQEAQKTSSLVLTLPAAPSCVSIAASGKLAAVGTTEGTLHLLDVETGQELKSLLSACDGISACEFLSETAVCLGAFSGLLELWSLREGCRLMVTDAHKAQITGCCTNADCKLLATVSLDGFLKLWASTDGHLMHQRDCLCPLNCVTFHPEGQLVATGGWNKIVTILDASDMSVTSVMKGHDASIHSISFSCAGNVLAAGSLTGSVHLWSWREAVPLSTFLAHSSCVSAALFLPGGKLLTSGEDCKVQLWAGHLGQLWSTLGSVCFSPALCAAPSPDGSRLAVGHHSGDLRIYKHPWHFDTTPIYCNAIRVAFCSLAWLDNLYLVGGSNDGSLTILNTLELCPPRLRKLQAHSGAVTGLAVFQNLVASTSEDFTVQVWLSKTLRAADPAAGVGVSPLAVLRGHTAGVTCCAFSLEGSYLATGGKDRSLFLWDVCKKTPSLWCSLPFCHQDWISSCAWAGPMLLTGSNDCTVCLWAPKTGQRLQEFLGHQSPVCGVVSEKEYVFSVGRDGMLVAWDQQGTEKTRFLAHPGRANHSAGFRDPRKKEFMLAAAGCDGTVKLWKPLKLGEPHLLPGHSAAVCGAAASPASSSFLTISKDNTVRVWTVPEKAGVAEDLPPHHGAVTALAWSPDGEFVVSGGERGDLIVWHEAEVVEKVKAGPHCISALAFTSPHTVLVATDGISLWGIRRRDDGAIGLTYKKCLRQAEEAPVLCVVKPRPHGPLVLGMTDGELLVLKPKGKDFQLIPYTDRAWDKTEHLSFDIAAAEEGGIVHIWDSMDRPRLFKMKLTKSGKLVDTETPEKIPWTPKRPSVWVTVARLVKDKVLLYADSEGSLWTQTQRNEEGLDKWEPEGWQRRKIHSDKITALHVLGDRIITASHDRDVKIWDGDTMKLLGQFRCHGPVSQLQPWLRDNSSLFLYVGDTLGNVYCLEWGSCPR
ncbi:telomerase protein component 1 [Rhineura floridana]|uniref:telomerase protein component 1 n=1 Tax=Rhineura floridana TaxID=261503 RepID=UPI002AC82010|nr:telomerase protein component 1 [Rhineura floridana]XP_061446486.1 telomerase protein component 1 [Rhineura floridana]XP_061446487.1 telomerase protein component 1 [Rhineura floridana]